MVLGDICLVPQFKSCPFIPLYSHSLLVALAGGLHGDAFISPCGSHLPDWLHSFPPGILKTLIQILISPGGILVLKQSLLGLIVPKQRQSSVKKETFNFSYQSIQIQVFVYSPNFKSGQGQHRFLILMTQSLLFTRTVFGNP